MSETGSISTDQSPKSVPVVFREGVAGLLVRGAIITAGLAAVSGLLISMSRFQLAFGELSTGVLLVISAVVWVGMMAGLVGSEYPRGDQMAMARLGLATFCRTGLPLVVVLVAVNYATRLNSVAIYVGVLYGVGLLLSLGLEVSRLGIPSFSSHQIG